MSFQNKHILPVSTFESILPAIAYKIPANVFVAGPSSVCPLSPTAAVRERPSSLTWPLPPLSRVPRHPRIRFRLRDRLSRSRTMVQGQSDLTETQQTQWGRIFLNGRTMAELTSRSLPPAPSTSQALKQPPYPPPRQAFGIVWPLLYAGVSTRPRLS